MSVAILHLTSLYECLFLLCLLIWYECPPLCLPLYLLFPLSPYELGDETRLIIDISIYVHMELKEGMFRFALFLLLPFTSSKTKIFTFGGRMPFLYLLSFGLQTKNGSYNPLSKQSW